MENPLPPESPGEATVVIPGRGKPALPVEPAASAEPASAPTVFGQPVQSEPASFQQVEAPAPVELPSEPVFPPPPPPPPVATVTPPAPPQSAPTRGGDNKKWIIIAVVAVLVLCCCCCAVLGIAAAATDGFKDISAIPWSLPLLV